MYRTFLAILVSATLGFNGTMKAAEPVPLIFVPTSATTWMMCWRSA